jgi:hypothetical protein
MFPSSYAKWGSGPARVLFRHSSTANPPFLDRISTGLFTGTKIAFPQQIHAFLAGFAHIFHEDYHHTMRAHFQQLFRMNSGVW